MEHKIIIDLSSFEFYFISMITPDSFFFTNIIFLLNHEIFE